MKGRKRRITRPQGDRDIVRGQNGFLGGMNTDIPASKIDDSEIADSLNVICYRTHIQGRAGTQRIGDLEGLTDINNAFFHRGMKRFIYLNGSDVYVATYGATVGLLESTKAVMGNSADTEINPSARTTLKAFGQNALIFQETGIFIIEISDDNSIPSFVRRFNEPNPSTPLDITTTEPAGLFVYRFTYTYIRLQNPNNINDIAAVFLSETGSFTPISTSMPYFTTVSMNVPLTNAAQLTINSFAPPSDSDYDHILVYRTRDINGNIDPITNPVGVVPNPNLFYATAVFSFDQAANYSTTVGIGNMTIGTTFIVSYSNNDIGMNDKTLGSQQILTTFMFDPLPNGSIGEVTPGFIFVSPQNSRTYYYSQTSGPLGGSPRSAGYHSTAFQFGTVDDEINVFSRSPDVVVILCNRSTYRLTPFTATNSGQQETTLGSSAFVIMAATITDDSLGVKDYGSIAAIDQSSFICVCTDNTVRIWDGTRWGTDLSRFKVNLEVQKIIVGSVGLYNPQGFYLLWYRTDESSPITNKCLRLGLVEAVGKGWTYYGGPGWSFPKPFVGCVNIMEYSFNKQMMVVVDYTDLTNGLQLVWVETYNGPVGSSMVRSIMDKNSSPENYEIPGMIDLKESVGAEEAMFLYHQETNFYFRPWDRDGQLLPDFKVNLSLYADGNITDTYLNAPTSGDVHFAKQVKGNRIRLQLNMNRTGFILVGYVTKFKVQDRTFIVQSASGEMINQRILASNLAVWVARNNVFINKAASNDQRGGQLGHSQINSSLNVAGSNKANIIGSVGTTIGPDDKTATAILLNGFLESGIGFMVLGSTLVVG